MTVGNYGGSVCNVVPDAGNDGVGVHDIVVNGGSGNICVYHKCFLGAASQQRSSLKRQNARLRPEESRPGQTSRRQPPLYFSSHGNGERPHSVYST